VKTGSFYMAISGRRFWRSLHSLQQKPCLIQPERIFPPKAQTKPFKNGDSIRERPIILKSWSTFDIVLCLWGLTGRGWRWKSFCVERDSCWTQASFYLSFAIVLILVVGQKKSFHYRSGSEDTIGMFKADPPCFVFAELVVKRGAFGLFCV